MPRGAWWVQEAPASTEAELQLLELALAASTETNPATGGPAAPVAAAAAGPGPEEPTAQAEEAELLPTGAVLVGLANGLLFISPTSVAAAAAPPGAAEPPAAAGAPPAAAEPQAAADPPAEPEPEHGTASASTAARTRVSQARLDRARRAGREGRRKVEGEILVVPPTPQLAEVPRDEKRVFVLLKARDGLPHVGFFNGRFGSGFAWYVQAADGSLQPDVVFHGWGSQAEAAAYWRGARGTPLWPVLSPQFY